MGYCYISFENTKQSTQRKFNYNSLLSLLMVATLLLPTVNKSGESLHVHLHNRHKCHIVSPHSAH